MILTNINVVQHFLQGSEILHFIKIRYAYRGTGTGRQTDRQADRGTDRQTDLWGSEPSHFFIRRCWRRHQVSVKLLCQTFLLHKTAERIFVKFRTEESCKEIRVDSLLTYSKQGTTDPIHEYPHAFLLASRI
jgi:hypothetical protein